MLRTCDHFVVNAAQERSVCFQTADKDHFFVFSCFVEEWETEHLVEQLNFHESGILY